MMKPRIQIKSKLLMRLLAITLGFATLTRCVSSSLDGLGRGKYWGQHPWGRRRQHDNRTIRKFGVNPFVVHRGGSTTPESDGEEQDEERYSRQVYTLGAKAHGRVRSSTVYIDGPTKSGLVYECAKNLALSGVGCIVIVTSNEDQDSKYHNEQYDDMGRAYGRAARAELGLDNKDDATITNDEDDLLVEFLCRLNPSLKVRSISRSDLASKTDESSGILLCIDRPYETQENLNTLARKLQFSFVSTETAGVYGKVFCDFGSQFEIDDLDGENPLVVPLDHLEPMEERGGTEFLVHCVDGEKHDVSKGDEIEFHLSNGEKLSAVCTVTGVKNPRLFSATLKSNSDVTLEDFISRVNADAASLSRIKMPVNVDFISLKEAMQKDDGSIFTPCDLDKSFDTIRRDAVMSCFQALPNFVRVKERLPTSNDFDEYMAMVKRECSNNNVLDEPDFEDHCRMFARCCAAKLAPLQAVFGAIASQETLKAATGLYNPIQQFLLYDCDELLEHGDEGMPGEDSCATTGQEYILGQELENALSSKRIFLVGSGAIGCEILKNLAAMGAGSRKSGCIIITDMDTIERSNLSRQLLFRDRDIGKFKSVAAQEAVRRFNPLLRIETHTSKVGEGSDGPFDDRFWSKGVHVVLNALDNVEARLYMDQQCVANKKALVDAGTLGSKGNVQVVVPNQSESYGSSSDPPEPAIPVCTLKNFPYLIAHTIQWGRDLFDGIFCRRPKQLNDYVDSLSDSNIEQAAMKLMRDQGDDAAIDIATELVQDVPRHQEGSCSSVRDTAIDFACELAQKHFYDAIKQLLEQHPLDSLDEDGEPFWSGSRKAPTPLSFSDYENDDPRQSLINGNILEFVRTAARLRIETYLGYAEDGSSIVSIDEAREALLRRKRTPATNTTLADVSGDVQNFVSQSLQKVSKCSKSNLYVAEFEKDDDSNGHVAFITAASNLRALCYGIPPVDAMETRRVAGNIVPAMITTTAFVSALSCIELLKLVKGATLERHRNAFINLALPFFAFTKPLPAEELRGFRGQVHTLWDRITLKEKKKEAAAGGVTLRRILKRLKAEAYDDPDEVEISSVSYGEFMIYANFLHQDNKAMLERSFWELVEEAVTSGQEFEEEFSRKDSQGSDNHLASNLRNAPYIDLIVVVEDLSTGEEVELPPVRVVKATVNQ